MGCVMESSVCSMYMCLALKWPVVTVVLGRRPCFSHRRTTHKANANYHDNSAICSDTKSKR